MSRFFVSLIALITSFSIAFAHYSIHSATSGVKIETNGKTVDAKKDTEIKANDFLVIPEGGTVEVYNSLDKKIYKSVNSGKISVTRLMIDAKKAASNHNKNVADRLSLAKNQGADNQGEKIYVEKGMVRRSLAVFDPEADNLQVNSKSLGSILANYITNGGAEGYRNVDVDVTTGNVENSGKFFRIVNTLDFPVYFNVLKYNPSPAEGQRKVEISMMGQPDGSYVLLPMQAITRESFASLPTDERHMIVVTQIRYDLDEVLEETGKALESNEAKENGNVALPLFILNL